VSAEATLAITGMNARPDNPAPGLAVARSIRSAFGNRLRIVGLGYDALDPGLHLPHPCDAGWLLPYPSAGAEALIERMRQIAAEEGVQAVIPCLDAEIPVFQQAEAELRRLGIRISLPSAKSLRRRAKDKLEVLARDLGARTPPFRVVASPQEAAAEGARLGWPVVVKGAFYGAEIAHGPAQAADAFARLVAEWGPPVLVQRFVAGFEVNYAAIGDGNGGVLGEILVRKQATTDKGKGWSCTTIADAEAIALAREIVAALNWRGPLEVEMLRARDGRLYLIEINPRFPAWIGIAAHAGCNLPAAWAAELLELEMPKLQLPAAGLTSIRYADEVVVDLKAIEAITIYGRSIDAKGDQR